MFNTENAANNGLPTYVGTQQQIVIGSVKARKTIVFIAEEVELRLQIELNITPDAEKSNVLLTITSIRGINAYKLIIPANEKTTI